MSDNVSFAILIDGTEYPAKSINSTGINYQWDRREAVAILMPMTNAQAASLFVDNLAWSVVQRNIWPVYGEDGQPTGETTTETQTFDHSEYCVAGTITDNRDGTVTVLMGKHTDLELAQAAQAEAESALAELEAAYDNG